MDELALYCPNLQQRLDATREYLASAEPKYERQHLEGCRGSVNAFAVFVGPSYGAFNGTGQKCAGGPNRPMSNWSKATIGGGLGMEPFPDGPSQRQKRWAKLMLACVQSEDA